MSKKMKIPSIFFKNKSEAGNKQPWQWPSCKHPKTLSFRATTNNDDVFKTVNSIFLDTSDGLETPESCWFTNSSSDCATSTTTFSADDFSDNNNNSSLEMIIRGVRLSDSERLFFEPGYTSSSILKEDMFNNKVLEANIKDRDMASSSSLFMLPFNNKERESSSSSGSVAVLALESDDPYLDFKKSMAEMVETHGLMKDWDCLEELLGWYLRMNAKNNHAFIVAAFLDLLVSNSSTAVCCSDTTSYSSADSCFSSHHSSPLSPNTGGIGVGVVVVEEREVISLSY